MKSDLPAVEIRPEAPEDEAVLREIYAGVRQEELDAWGWPAPARQAFLEIQFQAQQRGYRAAFPQAEFLVMLVDGAVVGRVVVNRSEEELRVVDIALLAAWRGRGIGGSIIQNLLGEGGAAGKPVRLSVVRGQRVVRLYERLGFKTVDEDAVRLEMEWRAA